MTKDTVFFTINLPKNYQKRYTLDFLVNLKALKTGKKKGDIIDQLSKKLDIKKSMMYYYLNEKRGSTREELSYERRLTIARYFGLDDPRLIFNPSKTA